MRAHARFRVIYGTWCGCLTGFRRLYGYGCCIVYDNIPNVFLKAQTDITQTPHLEFNEVALGLLQRVLL